MRFLNSKAVLVAGSLIALSALGLSQFNIKSVIKVVGVGAAVAQFGPQINKEINKLTKHEDTSRSKTKVVPIISVGINSSSAIGAAQVMGPPEKVDTVKAVAQPSAEIFGRELRIKALIPVSSENVVNNIKAVDGVGVSGIVDLKL